MRVKLFVLFALVAVFTSFSFVACGSDGPVVTEPAINRSGYQSHDKDISSDVPSSSDSSSRHTTWIQIQGDDLLGLFRAIDRWVEEHPYVEILAIEIVNNTEKDTAPHGHGESYTKPSGALIVYR